MSTSPHSPQRLATDLQKALKDLALERERTQLLLTEIDRQNAELDRLRSSVNRESNSRLLAEEALDESRDRMQLAVEATGLALWDWHLSSPQIFMTARWGEMVGDVAMDGYWETQTLLERVHPEDRQRVERWWRQLMDGQALRLVIEHRVRSADGWLWVESHGIVAEFDKQRRPVRLMGTLADISERKRVQAQIETAREQAEQANRAKSEFLANTSHEIRTPLNALMGLTQLLMASPINAEQRSWLELMDTSAQTLLAMLNDVLDLSRIEAGRMEVEHVRFGLTELLAEMGALYETQARTRSIQWILQVADDVPAIAEGDPGRLRQVLGNLISNALKFTPRGGQVQVSASVQQAPGEKRRLLRLQVTDTGVGIAARHQAAIFEAFTQADASTARRYGGSGLGLTICAKLVKLMGGRIDLESALGAGSTFTVTLPLLDDRDGARHLPVDHARDDAQAIRDAGGRFSGLQVLVAEDNPVNELLMNQWLERLGCTVHNARDGREALEQWQAHPIDVVLMDVQMPQMSGLEAVRQMRMREHERGLGRTPVVAVTANAMNGDRQACLDAGMDDFVGKPVSPSALVQALDRVHKRSSGHRAAETTKQPSSGVGAAVPAGPLDLTRLRRRLDDDEATLRQLARAMQVDLDSRLAELGRALQERNQDLAVAHAHGLKGSLGSMTAERGARLAKGLELAARTSDWALFGRALPLLRAEARQIEQALSAVINPTGAGD